MGTRAAQVKTNKEQAGPGTKRPTSAAAAQEIRTENLSARTDLKRIKVRAVQMGYYQHKRRREGDVFTLVPLRSVERDGRGNPKKDPKTRMTIPCIITPLQQFSDRWMEIVESSERDRITSPNAAIKLKHDEVIRERYNLDGGVDPDGDPEDEPNPSSDEQDDNVVGQEDETL